MRNWYLFGPLRFIDVLFQNGGVFLGSQLALVTIFEFSESCKSESVSLYDTVEVAGNVGNGLFWNLKSSLKFLLTCCALRLFPRNVWKINTLKLNSIRSRTFQLINLKWSWKLTFRSHCIVRAKWCNLVYQLWMFVNISHNPDYWLFYLVKSAVLCFKIAG